MDPMTATASLERFRDRREAGRLLAAELEALDLADPIVVALPRGGVPVAYEVARKLHAALDIMLVRKIGAPGQPELGIGAIGEDERALLDSRMVAALGVTEDQLERTIAAERAELRRRVQAYRPDRPSVDVSRRNVVLVDDGLATGGTAVAAERLLRARGARSVVLAVPVCPPGASAEMRSRFDDVVCLREPKQFRGVGAAYRDFSQTTDEEVRSLLARAGDGGRIPTGSLVERQVTVDAPIGVRLVGDLSLPEEAIGLVVFAHGSGSSRLSPRNRAVAARLNSAGLATLLLDLLTPEEAGDRANVFDIDLLAERLLAAERWAGTDPDLSVLPLGLFGASTGAAAALRSAATRGSRAAAVVSRGGRPDLAGPDLARVTAPTLLVVGGADAAVLELNRRAAALISGPNEVAVVPGAGHLFEEPGALERVAELATAWFREHLAVRPEGEL
jgi:predicted phosphoribosyltransferase/dienelactone hydrolase